MIPREVEPPNRRRIGVYWITTQRARLNLIDITDPHHGRPCTKKDDGEGFQTPSCRRHHLPKPHQHLLTIPLQLRDLRATTLLDHILPHVGMELSRTDLPIRVRVRLPFETLEDEIRKATLVYNQVRDLRYIYSSLRTQYVLGVPQINPPTNPIK